MQSIKALLKAALLIAMTTCLSGCYYLQAASGHFDLMSRRESIQSLIDNPETPEELRRRLSLVLEARAFSVAELGLPDNDSYLSYSDLERDYVLWNVFAADAWSLAPYNWCYPVVGCVGYRGYFREERANREADKLVSRGLDAVVGGVPAYSTLGNFDDPVVNTMMRWSDARLVGTLFHELAHQVLYIKNDTAFNESFATAVEQLGLERWLASREETEALAAWQRSRQVQKDILGIVDGARNDLVALYAEPESSELHERKRARLDRLSADVRALLESRGFSGNHWLTNTEIGNAHLVPLALYDQFVPAFRAVFEACEQSFECLYQTAESLGRKPAEARREALQSLMPSEPEASASDHRGAPAGTG